MTWYRLTLILIVTLLVGRVLFLVVSGFGKAAIEGMNGDPQTEQPADPFAETSIDDYDKN